MNKEALLAALETPKTINALQVIVNPGGSIAAVRMVLTQMRDAGLVRFDVETGLWSLKASPKQ